MIWEAVWTALLIYALILFLLRSAIFESTCNYNVISKWFKWSGSIWGVCWEGSSPLGSSFLSISSLRTLSASMLPSLMILSLQQFTSHTILFVNSDRWLGLHLNWLVLLIAYFSIYSNSWSICLPPIHISQNLSWFLQWILTRWSTSS